mmetsp:Transcript_1265/g.3557  ORF Transcript_1265/g.3557 Transcript_1265/m.3557 type:complete len:250 (+) Transcript_1265:298-1047(+)
MLAPLLRRSYNNFFTLVSILRMSHCWRKATSFSLSKFGRPPQSTASSSGTSARSSTSMRALRAVSAKSSSAWLLLDCFMVAAAVSTLSSSPNSPSSFAAPFGPTPGTPGTLSLASPIRASKSPICAGRTPNCFSTEPASTRAFFWSFHMTTRVSALSSLTSCIISLSAATITTDEAPLLWALATHVAMTSSASKPSAVRAGTPKHSHASFMASIWGRSAIGMAGRCALYALETSDRNVAPGRSKATTSR